MPRLPPPRLRSPWPLALASLVSLAAALPAIAGGELRTNPANSPRLLGEPIEDYRYDPADHCVSRPRKGAKVLARWLDDHIRGELWGIVRCERLSSRTYSVHAEGRAVDWHLDARVRSERRSAKRLIETLLATDRDGNRHALARRMGIQGLIFDCRAWWSGTSELGEYDYCYRHGSRRRHLDPTQAHIDHLHIELNRPGARLRTSFWRGRGRDARS
jgi:hypothetical protein